MSSIQGNIRVCGVSGAIIVPIHKSGGKDDPDNYRGGSLLSILEKVFALILNKRLTLRADENDRIVEEQMGFPCRSFRPKTIFCIICYCSTIAFKEI